ncbi:hypothetical protein CPC08DRAFT_710853 [Agrocybe pediades]|nr:hypothetical protein CPC08DRAFT_710853 [Agrocybe pediades]
MSESRMQTFRVVESEPEASLHPRAIWEHWQKHVIWDPRTYYGALADTSVVVLTNNNMQELWNPVQLQFISFRCTKCQYSGCDLIDLLTTLGWIAAIISTAAAFVVFKASTSRKKDPLMAELPSPVDLEDDSRQALWSGTADIADAIEDDSLEPEGQLRL